MWFYYKQSKVKAPQRIKPPQFVILKPQVSFGMYLACSKQLLNYEKVGDLKVEDICHIVFMPIFFTIYVRNIHQ